MKIICPVVQAGKRKFYYMDIKPNKNDEEKRVAAIISKEALLTPVMIYDALIDAFKSIGIDLTKGKDKK